MRIQLLFVLLWVSSQLSAQSGSFILSRYTANAYWNESVFPPPVNGKLYAYPSSDTTGLAWSNHILSLFKYTPADYDGHCVDSIQLHGTFTADTALNTAFNYYYSLNTFSGYRQPDPAWKYAFRLHGIDDTAYTIFSSKTGPVSASDTEICFFILPGSGDNQATAIVRNEGYHVTNCNLMNTLRKHGDVYVFVKPNEDFRAIRVQQLPTKKMVTDLYPTDSYLNQFLISNFRHEGINYLIECVAALKELKRKYKKVFLLGCSQGGYAGLYASLEAEPDGALISSGYSVSLDDNYLQFGNIAQKFAQLPFLLRKDSIKARMATQKSSYYFSWPTNDSPIYQAENQNHYTENYFNSGNPLTNVNYLYSYANHAFPPCQYIDSFVNQIKFKPKVFVTDTLNVCLYDSMVRQVSCTGQSPFSYNLYRNGVLHTSFTNMPDSSLLTLYDAGTYQVKDVADANGMNGICSEIFQYTKYPKAEMHIVANLYDCDSNVNFVQLNFQGTAPFHLSTFKKNTGGNYVLLADSTINDTSLVMHLSNGDYRYHMQDAIGCETLSDSLHINDTALAFFFLDEYYDCVLHKSKFSFALQGKPPYTVSYDRDGNFMMAIVYSDTVEWQLDNGNYFIINVTDANNCIFPVNQMLSIQYDTLSYQQTANAYDCDSNKLKVSYSFTGDGPWQLIYSDNGTGILDTLQTAQPFITFFLPNGQYTIQQVIDDNCSMLIDDTLEIQFTPLQTSLIPPTLDCDSGRYVTRFISTGGIKPYRYTLLYNSMSDTLTTYQDTTSLYLENGYYVFETLSDSLNCILNYSQSFVADYHPFHFDSVRVRYLCEKDSTECTFLITHQDPLKLAYSKNGAATDTITIGPTHQFTFSNGTYQWISLTDSEGCEQPILQQTLIDYHPIRLDTLYLETDCVDKQYRYHFQLQGQSPWTLSYNYENQPDSVLLTTNATQWTVSTGAYYFLELHDATHCKLQLNHADTLHPFLPTLPVLQLENNVLTALPTGYRYEWFKDNLLIDSGITNHLFTSGSGEYWVAVTDETGCSYFSNVVKSNYSALIEAYPVPVHTSLRVLVNEPFGRYWDYILTDMRGNNLLKGTSQQPSVLLDLRFLEAGIYHIRVIFENSTDSHILRIIKD